MSCSIPGLFLEVLQDPSVRAAPAVYDRIKMQREEATKNSVLLQKKGHHGYAAGEGGKEGRGAGRHFLIVTGGIAVVIVVVVVMLNLLR